MRLFCTLALIFCSFVVSATSWEKEKSPTRNSTSSIG
ncbi:penicillin-insensitive murein endopeptidase, partial [Vibrio sp. 10N.222.51.A6]